jgi:hypothetical protein
MYNGTRSRQSLLPCAKQLEGFQGFQQRFLSTLQAFWDRNDPKHSNPSGNPKHSNPSGNPKHSNPSGNPKHSNPKYSNPKYSNPDGKSLNDPDRGVGAALICTLQAFWDRNDPKSSSPDRNPDQSNPDQSNPDCNPKSSNLKKGVQSGR